MFLENRKESWIAKKLSMVRASENANEISGHHYMCFQAFTPDKCATGFEILAMTDLITEDTISGTSAM